VCTTGKSFEDKGVQLFNNQVLRSRSLRAVVPKLISSRTICGSRTVSTYHLVPANSIFQILFDQKFGKPELTQFRHEYNSCEKLQWPFLRQQWKYTKIQESINRTRLAKL